MRLTDQARRRMGARAADYVDAHSVDAIGAGCLLVADRETPSGVHRTLTRIYGRPTIPGDGEVAYWHIYSPDVERD